MNHRQVEHPFSMDRLNGPDDFRPEWDVPTLGRDFTEALSRDIDRVRTHPEPLPDRKIHLFAGQAGYGKTHLFGRIRHQQGDRVQFIFIPAPKTTSDIPSIARWPLIETLFASHDGHAPIHAHLSRLLAPSFNAYFDQLSPSLQAKYSAVRANMESDPLTALQICAGATELTPFHRLADTMCVRFPTAKGSVLRALVLSLSSAMDDARWWLRGEADQVPDERLAAMRLPPESPSAADAVEAVAQLLRSLEVPLILCFDQLEVLFEKDQIAFRDLTAQLMSWLQEIPNLAIAIGCFSDIWMKVAGVAGYKSFVDRVSVYQLQSLSADQAADFIQRRMVSWIDHDPTQPAGWPFDLNSVRRFTDRYEPAMRGFIQEQCRTRFDDWLVRKRQGLIEFQNPGGTQPDSVLFGNEWSQELEATRKDHKSASDTQESELWAAVEEALAVAFIGKHVPSGMTLEQIEPQALKGTTSDARPSARLKLVADGKSREVIVAVSKKDSGTAFGHWMGALEKALSDAVVGTVIVWPRKQLSVGSTSAAYKKYQEKVSSGAIRPFPLDEHEETFIQLECLRRMATRAVTKDLILNGQAISLERCRELAAETGVIAHLKLFEFLFENWPTSVPDDSTAKRTEQPVKQTEKQTEKRDADGPKKDPPISRPWPEETLHKTVEYLKKRGQLVDPLGVDIGPTFIRLKLQLRGDADFSKVRKQSENLKLHLALTHEPLIESQAGYVSVDVLRPDRETVLLPPLLETCPDALLGEPAFPVGKDVAGRVEWLNLSEPESCHLLIGGTTGSGKSEFLKAMLAGLAARLTPEQIRFRLIDPKRVTFNIDPRCPYLNGPVVYDGADTIPVLAKCFEEMERRYQLMQQRGVDHIRHLTGPDMVPRWVIVFDEFADLMVDKATKKELEPLLKRLGAKARAAGIHLVLGTQRPEASVVTPLLRSNLPGRIGLQVAVERESKLFLDAPNAAYLFGKGDLVWKRGGGMIRLQSPFVPKPELDKFLKIE